MRLLRVIISFLGSKTLTVWLVGALIVYYLTVAVWSREAFASFMMNLSRNDLFRVLYVIFVINAALRITAVLKALWPRRLRFFMRLPLYAGLLLFIAAAFMSLNIRQNRQMLVSRGQIIQADQKSSPLRVVKVNSALKKRSLRTDDTKIFDYAPSLVLMDRGGRIYQVDAYPPTRVRSTFMHILNFGIRPEMELKRNTTVLARDYVPLRLTPFGSVDNFQVDPLPYTFYISILPSRVIKKGNETARDYDLITPRYSVKVTKGDRIITEAETDSALSFDGDMSLRFFPPDDWVLLEIVYDPFFPWFVAGLALLLLGSVLYPFTLRR